MTADHRRDPAFWRLIEHRVHFFIQQRYDAVDIGTLGGGQEAVVMVSTPAAKSLEKAICPLNLPHAFVYTNLRR